MQIRAVLMAPLRLRAWSELAYVTIGLVLALIGFTCTIAMLYVGAILAITYVGLPLMALFLVAVRRIGELHRALHRTLGGASVAAPAPVRPDRPGLLAWVRANLSSSIAWRSVAYVLLQFPLSVLTAGVVIVLWGQSFIALISPILWKYHLDEPFPGPYNHWPMPLVLSLQGLVGLLIAPHAVHAMVLADRALMRWLLGPTEATERVHDLERTRALAVEDSAATLRRIERDLHDGAQVRLVGLGMNLTLMQDHLTAEPVDVEALRTLVRNSQDAAKQAIAELRDLVRGIHPPALDTGLEPALRTVCAQSAVPATLSVQIDRRPSPAIESIAYFCAAELIANAGKHSRATLCRVEVRQRRGKLRVRVSDDGIGGAETHAGGGLAGLTERVTTVDGRITISSPDGGPTAVTIDLPLRT
ncbi:MAG TPA: sensor domain-containing protein [Mycobacteriales bacterium]|nr:sensor domain-containing protein [Mycobacteriales bacterium]